MSLAPEMTVTTVLIVDDSAVDRQLAGGLLEQHGPCTILYAADGLDAVQQIGVQAPDVVLSDLQMPRMNGLELVEAVKRDFPLVPVILMTAQGSEDIAAQALRRGAAGYVPKRNLAADLANTVARVLLAAVEDRGHPQLMHYLETSAQVFVLGNDLEHINLLVSHVQQLLRCLPLADETERLRVSLALEEALTNAYYHGNLEIGAAVASADREVYTALAEQRLAEAPYRDRRIHVAITVSRNEAVFVVRDQGPGFDVKRLPADANLPDADQGAGRGVILMRTIMDEVTYNAAGNEVTLIKRRAPESPAESESD